MKYSIDFSLFCAPTGAYGYVTGEIELDHAPRVGEEVTLLDGICRLKIDKLLQSDQGTLISFSELVFETKEAAAEFGRQLEKAGFFCFPYDL